MNESPLVSVCMITYNHEQYVTEAIEGVLKQNANFPFELVIGEDSSTDDTRKICEQYQKSNPHKIRLLPSNNNLGMIENLVRTYSVCRGKYIAICEGDDYWTNANKLQHQVRFLEDQPEYSICAHNTSPYFQNRAELVEKKQEDIDYDSKDFILDNITGWKSCSIVFKNSSHMRNIITGEVFRNSACGDWLISYAAASQGKMRCFGASMGVYRIHDAGAFASKSWLDQFRMHSSAALAIDCLSKHEYQDAIIAYNVHRLFTEPVNKNGEFTISIEELMTEYGKLENKKWRRIFTLWFIKSRLLRSFYFSHFPILFGNFDISR